MKFLVAFLGLVAVAHGYVPRLDGRIVGGQDADIRLFPYQVSLRRFDYHFCGGAILDANTVLTAASCVNGQDHSFYSVRVGNAQHALGTGHRVNQVIQHRDYNPDTFDNDMAILKLASNISLSIGSTAHAVTLQPEGVEVAQGTTAWVSGWGVTSERRSNLPASLRAADVAVITNAQCGEAYGKYKISSHMMCAQTLGHGSCRGDSGGPLVADGRLIGIVSWGYGCANPQYPAVYAKVSDMYSWIVSNSY